MQNFDKWKKMLFDTLIEMNIFCDEKSTDSHSYMHMQSKEYCIITNSPSKFRSFYNKNLTGRFSNDKNTKIIEMKCLYNKKTP